MNRNEALDALQDAREATRAAASAYKAAWNRCGPGPKVDVAYDVLRDAEASERAATVELAPYLEI